MRHAGAAVWVGVYLSGEGDALKPAVDPGHGHVRISWGQLFEGVQGLQKEVGNLLPQQLIPGAIAVNRLSRRGHNEVSLQCTAQWGNCVMCTQLSTL